MKQIKYKSLYFFGLFFTSSSYLAHINYIIVQFFRKNKILKLFYYLYFLILHFIILITGVEIYGKTEMGECPVIGNNVRIGMCAKLLGGIKLENNVDIGPNSLVLFDIPDNKIFEGNSAKVLNNKYE